MRILAFAASLRKGSWNRRLLELGASIARESGAEVDLASFREFEMPMYDAVFGPINLMMSAIENIAL